MPNPEPYPDFGRLVARICDRPALYVGEINFKLFVAYIDGFNQGRDGGPMLGFKEWLIVRRRYKGGSLYWSGMIELEAGGNPNSPSSPQQDLDSRLISIAGGLLQEFLEFRIQHGIAKVFCDYAAWLNERDHLPQ
jgi:hypothetical protein